MVVIMKREFTPEQLEAAVHTMEEGGVKVMVSKGAETTILGAEGNAEHIDQEKLSLLPGVERVMRVTEPYKKANRKYHPEDTVIELSNGRSVGGNRLAVIAGPCSVESEAQIVGVAQAVKASGAAALRGGAFKPRTSPYAFQGMGNDGIRLLQEAKEATGLPIVTEIMSTDNVEMFEDVRGRDSGGSPEHAELRPAQAAGQDLQAHPAQARPVLHHRGVAHERRVHHGRGQPPGHPLRAGYPHL